jgi:hypothetical protein
VSDRLQARITALGGVVLSITPTDQSTIASMPILALEVLADDVDVTAINLKPTVAARDGRGRG